MSESIRDLDDNITQNYEIKKRVGKGAYGIVWKAVDRRSHRTVAIKKIFDAFRNQTDAQRTYREIVFLRELMWHPNIVRLHGVLKAANDKDIYLVFEYMETDLHNVIKHGNILREIHKQSITYQLLKAIKYIHSGNIIHRDLKPCNILINSQCHCKVADFGLARSLQLTDCDTTGHSPPLDPAMTDYVATRWYRAPEILVASKKYTKGIDMWSIGCILAEMVLGKPLFPGSSTVNQVEKIMSTIPQPSSSDIANVCPGYGSSLLQRTPPGPCVPLAMLLRSATEDCIDLVCRLLVFNPHKRLNAIQALKHPYVSKFHDSSQEFAMNRSVVPTLSDNVQLSIEQYRDKLYELLDTHNKEKSLSSTNDLSSIYDWYRSLAHSKNAVKSLGKKSTGSKPQEEMPKHPTHHSRLKSQSTSTMPIYHQDYLKDGGEFVHHRRGSESSSKSITSTGHSQAGSKSLPTNQSRQRKISDFNRKMPIVSADLKSISTSSADVKAVLSSINGKTNQRIRNEPIRETNVKHIGVAEQLSVKLVTVSQATSQKPATRNLQQVNNLFRRSSGSDNDVDRQHLNHRNHTLIRSKTLSHDASKVDINRNKHLDRMTISNARISKLTTSDESPLKKRTVIERQASLGSLTLAPAYKPKCGYITQSQLNEISSQVVR
ncbi:extracellular signal-regulated kinase 2 [Nilaparvata lugens]|uniref:extracellular signal-regulated kinase 2 n=1 Tax=Nilaparvata lugens TaxID=108931 RepID=UPI00193D50EC|nr:extracellular signal-regulated kinase 2 [Nilaparvata lugens]